MNRRDLLRAGLVAAVALGGAPALRAAEPSSVYTLEFPTPDGQVTSMSSYLGKPLVLNFWATWCPPCVKEMPDLDYLQGKHSDVTVVGLAVDTVTNVVEFGKKVPVSYPLLVVGHGGIGIMKDLGNSRGGLPFTLVFDAAGQQVKHFLGQISRDELDDVLASFNAA